MHPIQKDEQAIRVLIVDEQQLSRLTLARTLSSLAPLVEVLSAESTEQAIALTENGTVEILISDFVLTGINGMELIEKIRAKQSGLLTILMTAYDTPGLRFSANRMGINEYLVKPIDLEKISEIVSRLCQEIRLTRGKKSSNLNNPFTILIADDNPDNLRLLATRLQSEGYQFHSALDGEETLEKAAALQPDLLLLDINMPKKDGFQVIQEMRANSLTRHIPIIILTAARISAKDVRDGLTLGADDYMTKPVDWRELSARIQAKLRVKRAEDELRSLNDQLRLLPELTKKFQEQKSIADISNTLLSSSIENTQSDNGLLFIFDPSGSVSFYPYRPILISPWTTEDLNSRFACDGVVALAAATRKIIVVDDIQERTDWIQVPNDASRSAMVIPLIGRHQTVGVLILTSKKPTHFQESQLEPGMITANQAAIVIENELLFAWGEKSFQQIIAINQLNRLLRTCTSPETLLNQAPEWIQQYLLYPAVAIWEYKEEELKLIKMTGEKDAPRLSLMKLAPQQTAITGQVTQMSGQVEERTGERFGIGIPPVVCSTAVPIVCAGWNGVLSVHSSQRTAFNENDRVNLELVASTITLVIEKLNLSTNHV